MTTRTIGKDLLERLHRASRAAYSVINPSLQQAQAIDVPS